MLAKCVQEFRNSQMMEYLKQRQFLLFILIIKLLEKMKISNIFVIYEQHINNQT